jgi:hypothetical protein
MALTDGLPNCWDFMVRLFICITAIPPFENHERWGSLSRSSREIHRLVVTFVTEILVGKD